MTQSKTSKPEALDANHELVVGLLNKVLTELGINSKVEQDDVPVVKSMSCDS